MSGTNTDRWPAVQGDEAQERVLAKFIGTVHHGDLEGGHWTLVTDHGVVYQLKGGDSGLLTDGVRAEVQGRIATEQMGIAMVGDVLEVTSYRILD